MGQLKSSLGMSGVSTLGLFVANMTARGVNVGPSTR